MAGGVIVMTVGILLHLYGFAAGTLVTIVFLRVRAREWANDEDVSWIAWLSAALPELLGVIDFFRH
jgi:formate-dependent nitrite reductase membrane component NrfD